MAPVKIAYYSDVLCIWAYAAQRRLAQMAEDFGDQISIETRFCSVFPDARGKIETKWADRGTYKGFNAHSLEVAAKFPHIEVHQELWLKTRPRTSASAHLMLKALEVMEQEEFGDDLDTQPYLERLSTRAAWAIRLAFFAHARDIADWLVLGEIADELSVDTAKMNEKIRTSEAVTLLASDYDQVPKLGVVGSPTFLMNDGRQKLFGNVGYRLLEANVHELLRNTPEEDASWC